MTIRLLDRSAGDQRAPLSPVPGPIARRIRSALSQPGLVIAILVIAVALAWAIFPQAFTNSNPLKGVPVDKFSPPSWDHFFGTDNLGRDQFARTVYGSGTSLLATTIAVLVGFVAGSALGLAAGVIGGWVDDVVMRVIDVLLAIPALLLSLTLITVLGFGSTKVAIAVGISSVAAFARLMRAEVLRVRALPFVDAAIGLGASKFRVLRSHVLPNSLAPVLALATLEFGIAVLSVSALSFLGFGNPPPAPEWGSLMAQGRNYLDNAWWLTAMPGLVVIAVVLAASRISRAISAGGRDIRR